VLDAVEKELGVKAAKELIVLTDEAAKLDAPHVKKAVDNVNKTVQHYAEQDDPKLAITKDVANRLM
jgi:hypothetical protein